MIDPLSDAAFTDLAGQGIADADRTLRVTFFYDEIPDAKKTEEMGRTIFRSVEMCSIQAPGDRDKVVGRVDKMQPDPRRRFAAKYRDWKANAEAVQVEGTPLREWGVIDRATAKSYEAVNIHTVEQLAGLSDATCQQYRGSLADRQTARDWLAKAQGLEPVAKARAENAQLRSEIDALREAIASLGGKVPEPVAVPETPKRRGRPPKSRPAVETEA